MWTHPLAGFPGSGPQPAPKQTSPLPELSDTAWSVYLGFRSVTDFRRHLRGEEPPERAFRAAVEMDQSRWWSYLGYEEQDRIRGELKRRAP